MSATVSENEFYRAILTLGPSKDLPRRLTLELSRSTDTLTVGLVTRTWKSIAFGTCQLSDSRCYLELAASNDRDNFVSVGGGCFRVSRDEAQRIIETFGPYGLKAREVTP